ncbi:MAG: Dam family site-specific DNA-(adenine-N6)-methyltransferase [Bacteroidota bacterium]
MNKPINSPFRYAGGKFYARRLILAHIPQHSAFIEPFAGGGSIFFAKPKVAVNQLNDIDKELMNVYQVIKDCPEGLILFLRKTRENDKRIPEILIQGVPYGEPLPATKELHKFFKQIFVPQNNIEQAGRWYYLNRTSYSGIMNVQNMYWGYGDKFLMQPKNWPLSIRRTSQKLQSVELTTLDFESVIDNAPDGAMLFIDPPYFNADQDKFYQYNFSKNDHYRLADCLLRNSSRLKLFVTYDNTSEIKKLYSWMTEMHDKEWNYCIQRTDDQKNGTDKKEKDIKGRNYLYSIILQIQICNVKWLLLSPCST